MRERASPRLAFLHEDPHQWGGGEAVLDRLSRLASARGPIDLGLLFGSSEAFEAGTWAHFTRVKTFDFPHRLRWAGVPALLGNRRALRRWLQEGDVRACVAMTFATAFRTALTAAGAAIPLAWLCTFSVRAEGIRNRLRRSAALRGLGLSGALAICPSLAARDELTELGYPRARVRVINCGVELERFDVARPSADERQRFHQRHGIPAADLVALHVARLDPVKNHDLLLRAVAVAGRAGVRVALVCVGDTSVDHGDHAAGLRARAGELGVADRVLFVGRQSDIPTWLAAADVAVMSSHTETAGLGLIEGAAAGLPLLSSRVGAAPELVVPGRTGYLFDVDDAETCARHLVALAGNSAQRRAMGAEARRLAKQSFDVRETDRRWQALFAELLALPSPGIAGTSSEDQASAREAIA